MLQRDRGPSFFLDTHCVCLAAITAIHHLYLPTQPSRSVTINQYHSLVYASLEIVKIPQGLRLLWKERISVNVLMVSNESKNMACKICSKTVTKRFENLGWQLERNFIDRMLFKNANPVCTQ